MVTKTIPSKPKASKMEAELANEEESLTPEQEAEAREKAKSLVKKLADDIPSNVSASSPEPEPSLPAFHTTFEPT